MAFLDALFLLWSIPVVSCISLTNHVATNNQNLLPASRLVDLKFHHHSFERSNLPSNNEDKASFSSLLRRRDGLSIYGKDIVHGPDEPNYATLRVLPMDDDDSTQSDDCGWEAILLLTTSTTTPTTVDGSCFAAMNRFAVKEGCQDLFEERWAERSSKLPEQPGFLSFCLIRSRNDNNVPFNYSSLTLWKSFDAWKDWRNGDGRYSHDASRTLKRTPVSEWLEHSASPIFWDGVGTTMAESGV